MVCPPERGRSSVFLMKVAITGANGQLGSALIRNAPKKISLIPLTREDFDIRDVLTFREFIEKERPDVFINTAAFHNTLECEKKSDTSILINGFIPFYMAVTLEKHGGIFVFISTDYVFDGRKKGELYFEDDRPSPLNIYGYSKFLGETLVQHTKNSYIFRISSLFGRTSKKDGNFVLKILSRARRGEYIKVVNDIYMTPTYAEDAAIRMWDVILGDKPPGIYHVSNSGVTTWFDFAKKILDLYGIKSEIFPISYKELGESVRRPVWSPLGSKKLTPGRFWGEALKEYLEALKYG